MNNVAGVGINATSDVSNRLSVSSPFSLFSHEGTSHQLKINKSSAGDTASLIFENDFSGRAEIGLVGDDDFVFKTSSDGSNFTQALKIDSTSGTIQSSDLGINRMPDTNLHVYEQSSTTTIRIQSGEGGTFGSPFADFSHDGSSFYFTNWAAGNIAFTAIRPGTSVSFGAAGAARVRVEETAFAPVTDNAISIGNGTHRFSEIWSGNGVVQTSDQRDKNIIGPLTHASDIVEAVEPVSFHWKEQSKEAPANAGFIAQNIKAALKSSGQDLAVWGLSEKDNGDSRQWIKPDQLLAILWQAARDTRSELKELRALTEALKQAD